MLCLKCKTPYKKSRRCGHNNCNCECLCPKSGGLNRHHRHLPLLVNTSTLIGPPMFCGVELEFTTIPTEVSNLRAYGSFARDASITNRLGDPGYEFITNPNSGDHLVAVMYKIASAIQASDYTIDNQCGLHVHVNMAGFAAQKVMKVFELYTVLEKQFYAMCTKNRQLSDYCVPITFGKRVKIPHPKVSPWKSKNDTLSDMLEYCYGISVDKWPTSLKDLSSVGLKNLQEYKGNRRNLAGGNAHDGDHHVRYAGLNLHSYFHRGSLEFRLKEMTKDPDELLGWVLFCGWFCHKVASMPFTKAKRITHLSEIFDCPKTKIIRNYVVEKIGDK